MWQQMGWYPEELNMPTEFEINNNPTSNNTKDVDPVKSGEGYTDSGNPRASDVELLMEKMKELEQQVHSLAAAQSKFPYLSCPFLALP